ncbi:malectin domain-containing carbohydrate-binding protein [Rapidithrix thailandica]|uniref:Malectin domain-containing carbohydrate-binding protein n=1 Tax=Rapidithrix thailandica TaxID=413964 RepID=A0AAW9S5R5_9BACT
MKKITLSLLCSLLSIIVGFAQSIPDQFQKVDVVTGLKNAVDFTFLPDGRVLLLDRFGEVILYKPDLQTTVSAAQIPVFHELEDGLIGIEPHPDFQSNQHVFVHYSPLNKSVNRVSRFTMQGDFFDMNSEVVLLEWGVQRVSCCHAAGDIEFDMDGNLYIATGDNTNHTEYATINETDSLYSAERTSSNTMDLRGKILRIKPESDGSYSIPAGNLFPNGQGGRAEIYAMGVRNPYTLHSDAQTGWLYWGEVGPDAAGPDPQQGPLGYDEINLMKQTGNMGWPYLAGKNQPYWNPYENKWYDANAPKNHSQWNTGATELPAAQPAWIEIPSECHMVGQRYYYDPEVVDDKKLPIEFDGAFFYFDFNTHWHSGQKVSTAYVVKMDNDGNIISNDLWNPTKIFGQGFIRMKIGPDDHMYILEYGTGCCDHNSGTGVLVRLDYVGVNSNLSPVAKISADKVAGSIPLTVNFSSAGSYDPDGPLNELTYEWDFESDGIVDATTANASHIYLLPGDYNAKLKVKDADGGESVKLLTIHAGNNFAEFDFDYPADGGFFAWNERINYKVVVTDPEDGSTSGGGISCNEVNIIPSLGHLDHTHDDNTENTCEGDYVVASGDHDVDGDDDLYFVFYVNYTDQGGLTAYGQVTVYPKRQEMEFYDEQSGVSLINNTDPWLGGLKSIRVSNGAYVKFEGRNLHNISSVKYRVASVYNGGIVELRADSPTGTLLGSANVPNTGSTDAWQYITTSVTDPGGKHDLYFVFKNASVSANIFDINFAEFQGVGESVDDIQPGITEVRGESKTEVQVIFWEPVQQATAQNVNNYAINNGLSISSAVLQPDGKTVSLTTSAMTDGASYTVTVNNIKDLVGNTIPVNTQASFVYNKALAPLVRVNTGGLAVSYSGEDWEIDQYNTGSENTFQNYNLNIAGTSKDELYQTERWGDFTYNIPVPMNGTYRLVLHFSELYWGVQNNEGAGSRVFNVNIENNQASLYNFDILTEVAPATALAKTFDNIQVNDGFMTIDFISIVNNAKISAIEIYGDESLSDPPSVTILAPEDGSMVLQPFDLVYQIENWEVKSGGTHFHWIIDGLNMGGVYNTEPITFNNLELGDHTIRLELYNSNHTGTGIYDDVQITVVDQLPTSIVIDDPLEGAVVNGSFEVAFTAHSFSIPADGYISWSLDNGALTGQHTSENPISFSNVGNGSHTLRLDLMNSDNTSTGEYDIVQFEVVQELAIGTWTEQDEAEHHRVDVPNAVYQNKLYVFGGLDQVSTGQPVVVSTDALDPRAPQGNQWMVKAQMPTPVHHAMASLIDGEIWIVCGFKESNWGAGVNKVQIYNPNTNTWREGPAYPKALGSVALVRIGRKLHGISGLKGVRHGTSNVEVNDHYVLDLDNQQAGWQVALAIPVARNHMATVALGGKIYGIGGAIGHDDVPQPWQDQSRVDIFDPYTNTWSQAASLPLGISHHESSTFVLDGKIVVVSGKTTGDWSGIDDIWEYTPETNTWKNIGNVPVSRLNPASKVIGDTLIVTEGGGAIKVKDTYFTEVTRARSTKMGFWPQQISSSYTEATNGTIVKNLLLWTYTGETAFNLNLSSLPSWLTINVPHTQTGTYGAEVQLVVDESLLAAGTNSFELKAFATGYDTAKIWVQVEGNDPNQPSITITSPTNESSVGLSVDVAFNVSNWYVGQDSSHVSWVFEELEPNGQVTSMQTGMHMDLNPIPFTDLKHGQIYRARLGLMNADHTSAGYFDEVMFTAAHPDALQINAGGNAIQTARGNFISDTYFTDGTSYSSSIEIQNSTVAMQDLYQTERWGDFQYEIPVANGAYSVILHFAELYWGVNTQGGQGERVFDIFLEGSMVLSDYDIVSDVGPATAVSKEFTVNITDGAVSLYGIASANNPKISAIEIVPATSGTEFPPQITVINDQQIIEGDTLLVPITATDNENDPISLSALVKENGTPISSSLYSYSDNGNGTGEFQLPTALGDAGREFEVTISATDNDGTTMESFLVVVVPEGNEQAIRINAGGGTVVTNIGEYISDTYFTGGSAYSSEEFIQNSSSAMQPVYQTERWGDFQYEIPVSNGSYQVVLHFAELYWGVKTQGGQGERVFDILLEGNIVLDNYDIVSDVGPATAVSKTFTVDILDGTVSLSATASVNNPKISAIEVLPVGDLPQAPPQLAAIPDKEVLGGQTLTVPVSAMDGNGDAISLDVQITENGSPVSPSMYSFTDFGNGTGELQFFTSTGDAGKIVDAVVSATDNDGTSTESFTITVLDENTVAAIRINAGGSQLQTSDGKTWSADTHPDGDKYNPTRVIAIAGTNDDALYQSERNDGGVGFLLYEIPVPPYSSYTVNLHFAELWWGAPGGGPGGPGKRVFDINIENGQAFVDNYDINADVGPATATVKTFSGITDNNADGKIKILLVTEANKAKISAIEIVPQGSTVGLPPQISAISDQQVSEGETLTVPVSASDNEGDAISLSVQVTENGSPVSTSEYSFNDNGNGSGSFQYTPVVGDAGRVLDVSVQASDVDGSTMEIFQITVTPQGQGTPVRINAGGPDLQTNDGKQWSEDLLQMGTAFEKQIAIEGTNDDALYQTERNDGGAGSLTYDLPVEAASEYTVNLHFVELYWGVNGPGGTGNRVFDINIENGQVLIDNYDINVVVSPPTAVVETFTGITDSNGDGKINITLVTEANKAKISAIEILPINSSSAKLASTISSTKVLEEKAEVDVYPNPSPDVVTIDIYDPEDLPKSINIFNSVGQRVYVEEHLKKDSLQINLANYNRGLFVAVIKIGDKQIVRKISIK